MLEMEIGFITLVFTVLSIERFNLFGVLGRYGGSDSGITDEAELHQHQKLEKLYISTSAGKVA